MSRNRWAAVVLVSMLGLALAGSSGAAREAAKSKRAERAVPGELIVVFRPGTSGAARAQALAAAGLRKEKALTRDGRTELAVGAPAATERALRRLADDPRIAYAEPNFVVRALRTPNDPSFSQLWGLVNTGQRVDGTSGVADADIDAELAWDVSTGSGSVAVGIVDTGVDFSHPELAGTSWINQGENCSGCRTNGVDDDANGYVDDWRGWDFVNEDNDPFDDHGHGTHVAGTIAALGNNGSGIAGINWTGRVAALKFLDWFGSGSVADAVRAVDYATGNGIRITNNSWGGGEFSQALLDAIERFGAAGGLFVAAAGNEGLDTDQTPMFPGAYDSPAIVSVAATDSSDRLASFSNRGRASVDLGAPGVGIYSTLPGGGYDWWDGTSMATPHVAGTAALLKAAFPQATSMGIKALLLRTVDAKSALAETATGGRLNAGAAATCAGSPKLWLDRPAAGFKAVAGEPLRVVVLAAACADPAGVTVTATANGAPVTLTSRGDGLYSGSYTPPADGPLTIQASATLGGAVDARSVSGSVALDYLVSTEPYAWVDATAGGTRTGLREDDAWTTLSLPFSFRYYGQGFTSVKVSTNGFLVFGGSDARSWSNDPIPLAYQPNGVVAPLWDDLRLNSRGDIWYRTVGTAPNRRFVVSWVGAPHYPDVGDATFQAILEESTGDVVFQYQDVVFGDPALDHGASATVGVESLDGLRGRELSYNQASLGDYERTRAVRFSYGPQGPRDTEAPAAPTGLTAAAGVQSVALDWADNGEADLASYRVYRNGVQVATTSASAYTDSGLTGGVAYAYRVTAVDAAGNESALSNEATATPAAPRVATYQPGSFWVVAGALTSGSLASLAADDGNRLVVSGTPIAQIATSRTLPAEVASSLTRLRIDFDGHAGNSRQSLTLFVLNWTAGSFEPVFGPATGITSDRRLTFDLVDPRRYVSPAGEVRFVVRSEHRKGAVARTDLVSFTVEH